MAVPGRKRKEGPASSQHAGNSKRVRDPARTQPDPKRKEKPPRGLTVDQTSTAAAVEVVKPAAATLPTSGPKAVIKSFDEIQKERAEKLQHEKLQQAQNNTTSVTAPVSTTATPATAAPVVAPTSTTSATPAVDVAAVAAEDKRSELRRRLAEKKRKESESLAENTGPASSEANPLPSHPAVTAPAVVLDPEASAYEPSPTVLPTVPPPNVAAPVAAVAAVTVPAAVTKSAPAALSKRPSETSKNHEDSALEIALKEATEVLDEFEQWCKSITA